MIELLLTAMRNEHVLERQDQTLRNCITLVYSWRLLVCLSLFHYNSTHV